MNKFKGFKLGKGKADIRKIGAAVVATMLVVAMVIGLVPNDVAEVLAADKTTNIEGFSATMIADPDTSEDDHIFNGTPAEDGKIWTDKSVTTGAIYGVTSKENNFYVALSAMAQTYNTVETGMSAEEINIAYDVVFVLDFSGSMNERTTSDNSSPRKAQAMVNALNPAIVTLMENKQSRIAVVGYAGSNVSTFSATTLLSLDHYNTTSTNDNDEKIYFQYSNNTISTASGVTNSNNQTQTVSKQVNGGTPTQRGIYRGMDILQQAASNATGAGEVTRVPIIVLLTDGAAGSARSNYTTLSGGTFYEGDANNGDDDAEVGAYTVLTANYAKDTVAAAYKAVYDYSGISGDSIAKFYTIGLGITNNSWTHFMLNPKSEVANDATGNNATIIDNMQTILTNDATYGSDYAYADNYYGGSMTEAQLKEAFEDIVKSLQVTPQVTSTVNDPVATELSGSATGTVKFTDYLGYKMELKGDHQYLRYGGVNYRFDKQSDDSYKFSGYDQAGNAVTGPVITKNDTTYTLANVTFKAEWKKEIYNDQTGYWVITWEFPSALLPTYSRLNDYDNTDLDPIRMLYEVGLTEDVDLQKDSLKITGVGELASDSDVVAQYVFHTNLYDYANSKAMTWSEYKPAADNPFYYETGYTTDSSIDETETPYIRLDMTIGSTNQKTKQATADVQLNNISLKLSDAKATFYYDGVQYTVDLSGDEQNGATWSGEVSIPVIGHTATGPEVSVNVAARIEATYVNGRRNDDYLNLSKVTIKGTAATTSGDRNNGWSATIEGFVVGTVDEDTADTQEEIVSVYMELKGNETDGYYVEDANGNQITVTKDGDNYVVKLGDKTYYSSVYYKYADGTTSYVEKDLAKGTIARSLVGQFKIDQSQGTMTADNFASIFTYHASNGESYPATRITYPDGTYWGEEADPNADLPPKGTFKVCVDGIWNGLYDVNGDKMIIHFDFIVEEQTLEGGGTRYVVLDCSYYETPSADGNTYAVDVVVSDTPEIDEEKNYLYDVSYTIESTHASGAANVTQTDPHFFHSHFTSGHMQVLLGNNGRVAVDISTAYDKSVTVEKEWYDRLGNKIALDSEALNGVSITAGLYQTYQYTNESNETVINNTGNKPFATVELNQANNFTYTWEKGTLPKYLVDASGDYVIDNNTNEKVEIVYKVDEVTGADGWTLSETVESDTDTVKTFTLHNVPLAEFSPSVQKTWTDGAPGGYKVKIQLLADGEPVVEEDKIDSEHVVVATLTQTDANANGELSVTFGGVDIGTKVVQANTSEKYEFTYDNDGKGIGGAIGSGTHADSVKVTVSISNSNGEGAKLSIADATVTYNYTVIGTDTKASVTLATFRSQLVEEGNTKTVTYIMSYHVTEKAEVILDGIVDTEETTAWYNKLDKWNLPMLSRDESSGNYKAIVYSIQETVLVPDESGSVEIDGKKYKEYTPDANGLISISQADGSVKVFKMTIAHTEDYQFTVTNDEALTSVSATKVWVDNNNAYGTRPDKITFKLKADDSAVADKDVEITSEDTEYWNGTKAVEWTNLPLYNTTTGKEIVYTVEETMEWTETTKTDEYKTIVTGDSNNFVVTNSLHHEPAVNKTFMGIEKEWIDDNNAAGTRPENIYMVLYRKVDGTNVEELVPGAAVVTLNEDNEWKDDETWTELAKYNEEGKKYIYSVKEYESLTARNTEGVSGYTDVSSSSDKTATSYKFTNQLDDGIVSKTVTKEWKDAALDSSTRPNVTVVLSGKTTDGEPVDLSAYAPTQTLSLSWTYTWNNLPVYSNGMKIDYTITETKIGDDEVSEGKAGNYEVSVQDDRTGNDFTITNTLTGTTTVTVTKKWVNTPENYDIPTVTFDVYNRYGGKVEDAELTVTRDKPICSIELPKYNANGEEFYYTVEEQAIAGTENYKINSSVTGGKTDAGVFVYEAENTYVPLKRDIEGTKTWVGVTGGNIPTEITLELSRKIGDGEAEVVTATPTWNKDGVTWTYKYTNLPVYENDDESKPYDYSIKETAVDGVAVTNGKAGDYEVTVDGFNITNKLTGTVQLSGKKTWANVSSNDNVPDTIKVQLFRKVGTGAPEAVKDGDNNIVITVNKADQANKMEWSYNFDSYTLAKYDTNGNAYEYFVKETEVTAGNDKETASYTTSTTGTVGDYEITLNGMNITNTLKQGDNKDHTTELPFTKLWRKADGTALTTDLPDSITVQLLQDGSALNPDKTATLTSTNADASDASKWTGKFENLRTYKDNGISKYKYTVNETKVETVNVDQTTKQAGAYTVSINADGNKITNALSDAKTDITIKKTWKGVTGDNIPSIKVQLLQSGTVVKEETLTKDTPSLVVDGNTWTYTFKDLPVYQANGIIQHVYTVKEVEIAGKQVDETTGKAGDYQSTIDACKPLEITNELTGIVDKIEGKKIWKDVAKVSERPKEITVALLRKIQGGTPTEIATQEVSGTEWGFVFTKDNQGNALNKYDPDGNEYIYSVAEKDSQGNLVEEGKLVTYNNNQYRVSYGESVYTITNTLYGEYDPKYNPIKVTKVWLDDDNSQKKRPDSISMTLVQNGDLETIGLTAQNPVSQEKKNEWSGAFTKTYPMYDAEGALISYSVTENSLKDYTLKETKGTAAEGFTLTNVYTPDEMTITVNKTWVDNSNALNTRPETLTLNLLQNGEAFGTIELKKSSQGNTWTATKEVPSTDENGKLYTYTVKEPEDALKGTDYVKTSETGLTVTNTLQAEVHVQGTKTWKNIDKEYRPESITVELWRKTTEGTEVQMTDVDGKVISITTNAEKEWKYDFGNFAKYDENGALYTYIVKETKIGNTPIEQSDYTVSNGEGYDLTNKLKDIKITISGKKTWVDNNDQYKMRPKSITVNLLRDGAKVASVQVKAAADGTWTYEFKDLPKYNMDNGKLYTYSVEETAVENYKSSVNGYDITNTLDETKIPTPSAPKTSDSRTAAGYALTTLIALAAVATAFFRRKRIVK